MTPKTKTTLTRRQRSKERQDASKGRKAELTAATPTKLESDLGMAKIEKDKVLVNEVLMKSS